MLIGLIVIPFFLSWGFGASGMSVLLLFVSQLALLLQQVKTGRVTGVGGFLFMSFLFFGMRPLYLFVEDDYQLFSKLFLIEVDLSGVIEGMWWGTAAMIAFWVGSLLFPEIASDWLKRRRRQLKATPTLPMITNSMVSALIGFQVVTLPVMIVLSKGGRSVYGSGFGAYAYDLPVPLQAVHIFALVVIFERYRRRMDGRHLGPLLLSGALFLVFTWLMREVSMFRGFYVAGVMIAGIALVQRYKGRASYAWLILPVVLLQPLFETLGELRYADNQELGVDEVILSSFEEERVGGPYWHFYHSSGDMNIFDTFVAAHQAEVSKRPYAMSWLYVPVHFVPRAIWESKPEKGTLQDLSFMNGAPYCPGIAGFFLLDGGQYWMLLSMALLGFIVGWLDGLVNTLPNDYLKACLLGIVVVNAMFLTRFFLWQAFYQLLYAVVPCWFLARYLKNSRRTSSPAAAPRKRVESGAGR